MVDVYSESGHETVLADLVEQALLDLPHLQVTRDGDAVVGRTVFSREQRVILAGHLDTVPPADNLPARLVGDRLSGLGTADMKSGLAVMLRLAGLVTDCARDLTYVFYDGEEVEAVRNGLKRLVERQPQWLTGDLAVLMEPTGGVVEGGCQGSLRVDVVVPGRRPPNPPNLHGEKPQHPAGEELDPHPNNHPPQTVVDGLAFHEGLNAVGIRGGVAGNVIPDEAVVTVNYRFAPDRDEAQALSHVRDVFAGFDLHLTDSAAGARPGLDQPLARDLVEAIGGRPRAKLGWTDVARFSALGIPAVNYGPGDPALSHTRDEHVPVAAIREAEDQLLGWLTGRPGETAA